MDTPKTKQFLGIMNSLKVGEKKTLFVIPEYNDTLFLSSRNIPNAATTLLSDINTYDIVNADVLVMTESAVKIFTDEDVAVEEA
jgi:large subunit ribosomal protein L4